MNIKENIRAEIERRIAHFNKEATKYQYCHIDYANNCFGARDALRDLRTFLDDLPEQPVEGLDVTDFCKPIDPGIAQCVTDHWWEMIGEESTNKKPVDGLDEEMEKFFETMPVLEHENIFEDTFKNIARHFAAWGAEHLKR